MIPAQNHVFSIQYDSTTDQLKVLKNKKEVGQLNPKDFAVQWHERMTPPRLTLLVNITPDTSHKVKILKIKEKRLHFAKHYPVANGVLNMISCLCIGVLTLPWIIGALVSSPSGNQPNSLMHRYLEMTQGTWHWMQPVFINKDLEASIEENKNELISVINSINTIYTTPNSPMQNINQTYNQYKDLYGEDEKMWGNSSPTAKEFAQDLQQIQQIVLHTLGQTINKENFDKRPEGVINNMTPEQLWFSQKRS